MEDLPWYIQLQVEILSRKGIGPGGCSVQETRPWPGENDNQDVILLKEEVFAKAVNLKLREKIRGNRARDPELVDLLTSKGKIKRPGFGKPEDWTDDEGILLYRDKVYVPPDDNLRRDIVQMYHKPRHMAHPGIQKTKDLVKWEYF